MPEPVILNFGSCCIDNVYQVPAFVKPGETLPCTDYQIHAGGKGLNQSLALAYAGAQVVHAGKVGQDGVWMRTLLDEAGVDVTQLKVIDSPSGHAVIQVTPEGENAIVIHGGANQEMHSIDLEEAISAMPAGSILLIQNEMNRLAEIIELAHHKALRIVFNAAPMTEQVNEYPLQLIEVFVVNELEGAALTGESVPEKIADQMVRRFPKSRTVLTLGEQGAIFVDSEQRLSQAAFEVTTNDATGAGDTFTGYFLSGYARNKPVEECLNIACKAAAICVTRPGAASSIPKKVDLNRF